MTRFPLRSALFVSVLLAACANVTDDPIEDDMSGVGGTGSGTASGGDASGGGSTGGAGTGGASSGGSSTGGVFGTGGATGGTSTGGAATGGATTGGASTGGAATGGASTGGTATGGAATGGTSTGGAATGGTSTGGAATGGTTGLSHSNDPVDCTGKPAYSVDWVWSQGNGQVTAVCSTGTPCTQGSPAATSGKTYLFECTHSHKPNCQGQDPGTMNWSDPPWTRVGECTAP